MRWDEMPKCDRCRTKTEVLVMSRFNTDLICLPCEEKEKEHPDYQKARDAEEEACKRGDYNYKGIGKPSDL